MDILQIGKNILKRTEIFEVIRAFRETVDLSDEVFMPMSIGSSCLERFMDDLNQYLGIDITFLVLFFQRN